jgi:formamidopyrimidine-DNA glycosylase
MIITRMVKAISILCKTCKRKKHCQTRKKLKGAGCMRHVHKGLLCDICGKPIEPPGTGALMGGDGLFYCAVCRIETMENANRQEIIDERQG